MDRLLRVALLIVIVEGLYGPSIHSGFDWDDYTLIRQSSSQQLASTWTGDWDVTGMERPFYRPLAAAWFAVMWHLIGPHPIALHLVNLAGLVMVALLLWGWLVALGLSRVAALFGAAVFVVHPLTALSTAIWITNQQHLVQLTVVIASLWLATAAPRRWPWLLVLQTAAMLVKEDGVMLAPAVAVLWWARGVSISRRWAWASLGLIAAYGVVRILALGVVDAPTWIGLIGMAGLAVVPHATEAGLIAAALACTLITLALMSGRRRLWVVPAALAMLFDLPLIFAVPMPTHWHLLALSLALACALAFDQLSQTPLRPMAWTLGAACLVALGVATRAVTAEETLCSPSHLEHAGYVLHRGAAVQPVMVAHLLGQIAACTLP